MLCDRKTTSYYRPCASCGQPRNKCICNSSFWNPPSESSSYVFAPDTPPRYQGMKRKSAYVGMRPTTYQRSSTKRRVPSNISYAMTRPSFVPRPLPLKRNAAADLGGMDTGIGLTPVISTTSDNASSFVLNLIQQGNGSWNRVGRKIQLVSARIRATISHQMAPATTSASFVGNRLRMILVWDKSPNSGTIPAFDTVFGLTDQTGAEATTLFSPIKYDNMGRFNVVRDSVIQCLVTTNNSNTGTVQAVINFYEIDDFVPLVGKETVYSGQSSPMTIADISTGALYLYFRAEVNTAVQNFMTINPDAFCRLRYRP